MYKSTAIILMHAGSKGYYCKILLTQAKLLFFVATDLLKFVLHKFWCDIIDFKVLRIEVDILFIAFDIAL